MQTRLVDLVLNVLRKAQYQISTQNADELYLVTDDYGVTSADVVNALGYTPYNGATNPNGYIDSSGAGNGQITLTQDNETIGSFTVNQTTATTVPIKGLYDYTVLDNITIVGNPTIQNNVISDFTTSNYAKTTTAITLPTYWEMWIKFKTGPFTDDSHNLYILGGDSANPDLAIYADLDGDAVIQMGATTQSTDIPLAADTIYYMQLIWGLNEFYESNPNTLYVALYNKDKIFVDDNILTGFTPPASLNLWFGMTYGSAVGFDGSVDLNETLINKINYDALNNTGTPELLWKGITSVINSKADIDLSNLSSAGQKVLDGQWVCSELELSVSTAVGTYSCDLSTYLPNDGYNYEVMFHIYGNSANSSGAVVSTDLFTVTATATNAQIYAMTNSRTQSNDFILPVGTGRTATLQVINNAFSSTLHLYVRGYRRIGTNS